MLQVGGWAVFLLVGILYNIEISGISEYVLLMSDMTLVATLGLLLTHAYRAVIKRLGWNQLGLLRILPRILISSAVLTIVMQVPHLGLLHLLQPTGHYSSFSFLVSDFLSLFPVFLFWSVIYFAVVFFRNYRTEEIKNLKMSATMNEVELNKIKSQLNPHFMFNAMNSIRALIDEDPTKAKTAVTQLSNILRTTLLLGKKKQIPFDEEWRLVRDYVGIESARYEERLRTSFSIAPEASRFLVPPLMIQTLVENAIKHGISNLPEGGKLEVNCSVSNDTLHIRVTNPGTLGVSEQPGTGFGLKNSRQRLELLYGSLASLEIREHNGLVITEVVLPETVHLDNDKAQLLTPPEIES